MGLGEVLNKLITSVKDVISILIILAVLVLVIFILRIVEKRFKKKLKSQKKNRNLFYNREIKKLSKLKVKSEEFLDSINDIARNFFKEAFDLPYNLEYLELIEEFRKTGNKECISFCKLISELNYSGEKIEKPQLMVLIKLLNKIIEKNKILSEEEKLKIKEETERKKGKKSKLEQYMGLSKLIKLFSKIKNKFIEIRELINKKLRGEKVKLKEQKKAEKTKLKEQRKAKKKLEKAEKIKLKEQKKAKEKSRKKQRKI